MKNMKKSRGFKIAEKGTTSIDCLSVRKAIRQPQPFEGQIVGGSSQLENNATDYPKEEFISSSNLTIRRKFAR